jgi:two-component sensor histidine kinase
MTRKQITIIAIHVALAITWSLFACLVVWGIWSEKRRTDGLAAVALERILSEQQTRLSAGLRNIERGLRAEASYVTKHDSLGVAILTERWLSLMDNEWSILSIGVASENGSVSELARLDGSWRYSTTPAGEELPLVMEWPLNGDAKAAATHIGDMREDPRHSLWFGQSMVDRATDPAWSVTTAKDSSELLHVSVLVRSAAPDKPFRIIRFSLSPERFVRSLGAKPHTRAEIYLGPNELAWSPLDTSMDGAAMQAAVRLWRTKKTKEPFRLETAGGTYMCRISGSSITGTSFYAGAALPLTALERWNASQRKGLWSAAALLLLLGGLVTWALLRGRRVDQLAERQEKKSRTQERKLAKAIGEREILDREVHHRVKNNLQVVSSILNLQAGRIADAQAKLEYMRGKRRIDSMALVHHKLYAQTDLRNIDLNIFLTQVTNAMKAMFEPNSRSVSHSVDTGSLKLNADTSIQVGIILCELLTNCYTHAFPYVTGGHIEIVVRMVEPDLFKMSVKDNGKGLVRDPEHMDLELGLELVEALADQIDGHMDITLDNGTCVDIFFRMQGDGTMRTI